MTSGHRAIMVAVVAICLCTVGCGSGQGQAAGSSHTFVADASGARIQLTLAPYPLRARRDFDVTLRIASSGSTAAVVRKVWITEEMNDMEMPTTTIDLSKAGSDEYTGTGLIVMGGPWKLDIHVQTTKRVIQASVTTNVQD